MSETLTIDTVELVTRTPSGNSGEYMAALKRAEPKVKGPGRTLRMALEDKVAAHMEQFEEWREETIAAGRPLNGIYTSEEIASEAPIAQLNTPEMIVLFESNNTLVNKHLEEFETWKKATVAAGRPLNGVHQEE